MTDLDRIKEVEKIFNFTLTCVDLKTLFEQSQFDILGNKATRGYSIDKDGYVNGLSLDFSPLFLLPDNYLLKFEKLQKLKLKNTKLNDYSFLRNLQYLTDLDLSFNDLTDVSFLKELKLLKWLNLRNNKLVDVSYLKELKSLKSLNVRKNNIKNYHCLREMEGIKKSV